MDYSKPAIQRRLAAAADYAGLNFLAKEVRDERDFDDTGVLISLSRYTENERDLVLDIFFAGDDRHVDLKGNFPNAKRVVQAMKRAIKLPEIPLKKLDDTTRPSVVGNFRRHLRMLQRTGYLRPEEDTFLWHVAKIKALCLEGEKDEATLNAGISVFRIASNVDGPYPFTGDDVGTYVALETRYGHENWARPLMVIRECGILVRYVTLTDDMYRAGIYDPTEKSDILIDVMKHKGPIEMPKS